MSILIKDGSNSASDLHKGEIPMLDKRNWSESERTLRGSWGKRADDSQGSSQDRSKK